jgi:hypothetical protein
MKKAAPAMPYLLPKTLTFLPKKGGIRDNESVAIANLSGARLRFQWLVGESLK